MTRYVLHVYSRPVAGEEERFVQWYRNVHLAEVLKIDGFVEAQHYGPVKAEGFTADRHFARFVVDADAPSSVLQRLGVAWQTMVMSDALDSKSVSLELYEATSERLEQ